MNPLLKIGIQHDQTHFSPGAELSGAVLWEVTEPPRSVELRLFWFTGGSGTPEAQVVDSVRFETPLAGDTRTFRFQLPAAPYSFTGKLCSLVWALELVLQPGAHSERLEFVVAPGGKEIVLPETPPPVPRKRAWFSMTPA